MHRMDKGELFEETMFRSDRNHWVRRSREEESNMIPWEEDIIIYNFVSSHIWSPSVISIIRNGFIPALPWKTTLFVTNIQQRRCQPQSSHTPHYIKSIILIVNKITKMIIMQTRILKNQEACANTLSMECMDFYHR